MNEDFFRIINNEDTPYRAPRIGDDSSFSLGRAEEKRDYSDLLGKSRDNRAPYASFNIQPLISSPLRSEYSLSNYAAIDSLHRYESPNSISNALNNALHNSDSCKSGLNIPSKGCFGGAVRITCKDVRISEDFTDVVQRITEQSKRSGVPIDIHFDNAEFGVFPARPLESALAILDKMRSNTEAMEKTLYRIEESVNDISRCVYTMSEPPAYRAPSQCSIASRNSAPPDDAIGCAVVLLGLMTVAGLFAYFYVSKYGWPF